MQPETLMSFADAVDGVKQELRFWVETLLSDFHDDPVFESMVRQFLSMEESLRTFQVGVTKMLHGYEAMTEGLDALNQCVVTGGTRLSNDTAVKSDAIKFNEACHGVTRSDAPHSAFAKLKRDLNYNISTPLSQHLQHIDSLKNQLVSRRRLVLDVHFAKVELDTVGNSRVARRAALESQLQTAERAFQAVDRPLFEWLLMYQEHSDDIVDSFIQTLKYINYEFANECARGWQGILPKTMEFRPMIEMTPQELQPLVDMEVQATVGADATSRLLERLPQESIAIKEKKPVDPFSLQILQSQGFEESLCVMALRECNDDTQSAMNWLIDGCPSLVQGKAQTQKDDIQRVQSSVRVPTTLKWIAKLKESKDRRTKLKKRAESEEATEPITEVPEKACDPELAVAFDPWTSLRQVDHESSDEVEPVLVKEKRNRTNNTQRKSLDSLPVNDIRPVNNTGRTDTERKSSDSLPDIGPVNNIGRVLSFEDEYDDEFELVSTFGGPQ